MDRNTVISNKNKWLKILNIIALLILFGNWIFSVYIFPSLPEKIPVHFDASGKADRFGSKITYLFLPVLATLLYVFLTYVNRFPRFFEYAKSVTGEKENPDFGAATQLLHIVKIAVMVLFATIQVLTYTTVAGLSEGLGGWFMPFTLGILLVPIAVFLIRSRVNKNN